MSKKALKNISLAVFFALAILFLGTIGKPAILKSYIYTGVGNCKSIPILCKVPESKIVHPKIDQDYLNRLLPYVFEDMTISLPKGFTVVKGEIRKVYYKKWHKIEKGSVVYLLYRKPNFFINLFPNVVKQGVVNDYEFITRLRYAQPDTITNLTDTFFVVMKSIFTPDLGDQSSATVIQFASQDKKGFINYNLGPKENYFDCEIINNRGDFFKIYIRDKARALDLDKIFTIISTVRHS